MCHSIVLDSRNSNISKMNLLLMKPIGMERAVSMKADCKVEGEKCFSHVRYRLVEEKEGNRGEKEG